MNNANLKTTENKRAKKCYESVGFRERHTDPDAFRYMDESWGRCNMVIEKDQSFAENDIKVTISPVSEDEADKCLLSEAMHKEREPSRVNAETLFA